MKSTLVKSNLFYVKNVEISTFLTTGTLQIRLLSNSVINNTGKELSLIDMRLLKGLESNPYTATAETEKSFNTALEL